MGRIAKEDVKEMPEITITTFDHIQHEDEKDRYIKQLEKHISEMHDKFNIAEHQLEQKKHIETYNREVYEELHNEREKVKDLSRMVTVATEEYKALEVKYEALKEYAKVIM